VCGPIAEMKKRKKLIAKVLKPEYLVSAQERLNSLFGWDGDDYIDLLSAAESDGWSSVKDNSLWRPWIPDNPPPSQRRDLAAENEGEDIVGDDDDIILDDEDKHEVKDVEQEDSRADIDEEMEQLEKEIANTRKKK